MGYMAQFRKFAGVVTGFTLLLMIGCGGGSSGSSIPDYSQTANWLVLSSSAIKNVDVFYIYPTAYKKATPSDPVFCAIDNPTMVQGAQRAYQQQATAFAPYANIFAPYYRQVDATYQLALPFDQQDENIRKVPGPDVIAAFEYYLQHYNNGRPFILVGHSQGAAVLKYLLADYMTLHPDVYQRMIAAYVVGQSITPQYLAQNSHLRFATGSSDTGVIVSWNTEAPTTTIPNPITQPGGIAINPITWTLGENTAAASQNLGSLQLDATGFPVLDQYGEILRVTGLADARVDQAKGVVICSTVNPAVYNAYGIYHNFDIPFYFFNLRQNAADRIAHYFSGNSGN
ncbi:DUF3089 domain-containing protein [Trichlorobacter lovleyi]|uniref:DUF3089 domain-containing protein n=1 Tax=Trichlorobacter lovleyi TaxID=313985 RepID=UPI0023EFB09B|nr:DUF3089 domain-containing protein [Trichlorobacter lovleyi]